MVISQSVYIIIIIIYFVIYSNLFNNNFKDYLNNNWRDIRCQPHIIPIAGLSDSAEGTNFFNKTFNNFNSCTSGYIKSFMSVFLAPFISIFGGLTSGLSSIRRIIDVFRRMSKVLREMFATLVENTAKRMANSYSAIMYFQEKLKVLIKKQTAMFEVLSQFAATIPFMLYSFSRGPIPRFGVWLSRYVGVLIAVFVICLACIFGGPFTKMVACPICAVCFTGDTKIDLPDNTSQSIKSIKIGDKIKDNTVIGTLYIKKHMADTYTYNETIVSGSHLVFEDNKWVRIENSKKSIPKILNTDLYCLITSNNTIVINDTVFRDYEESVDRDIKLTTNYKFAKHINNSDNNVNNESIKTADDINHCYYWGFSDTGAVYLDGEYILIKDLINNPNSYNGIMGVVAIDADANMYNYKGIIVSGSTLVYDNNMWMRVFQTKCAIKSGKVKTIYNLISNNSIIIMRGNSGNISFRDFIESSDDSINDTVDKLVEERLNAPLNRA